LLAWMMSRPVNVKPLLISKANTCSQIALAGVVLAELGLGLGLGSLVWGLVWLTGTLTILSAFAYFWSWLRHMARYEPTRAPRPPRKRRSKARAASAPRSGVQAS